jgi:hypothetical protein
MACCSTYAPATQILSLHPADGDYGWGLLLRTLADVLQHDRRAQVVDAALEMVFGLLSRFSNRWDAAAWRVLVHRVLRHMLALPPALQAALNGSMSAGQTAAGVGQTFGQTSADPRGGSFSGFPALPAGQQAGRGSMGSPASGGGAGGGVPAGLSVAEQRVMMTNLLQRMDRYYPLLCEQAAAVRPEFKVRCCKDSRDFGCMALSKYLCHPMVSKFDGVLRSCRRKCSAASILCA